MKTMIPVPEAITLIQHHAFKLSTTKMKIEEAMGQTLAKDVLSPIDMPPFDQSAMDGYAINDVSRTSFELIGELQAGDSGEGIVLQPGQAIRIFTGAVVPESASSVVKQEIVERNGNTITIPEPIQENENIRPKGEQVQKNTIALKAGTVLSPGSAGFLFMLGLTVVEVIRKPKVAILATGNELVSPGQPLPMGKIYESNTYSIKAALKDLGIDATITTVEDDFEATKKAIEQLLDDNDLLITTGGISVGDYDFIGASMKELGVETIFYKVKQKPGKPLYFGKKNETLVFGLPGNPAAALTGFYMYITAAIKTMMGDQQMALEKRSAILTADYTKTPNLSHFLKGVVEGNEVTVLGGQSSAMLSSFGVANCLLFLPDGQSDWKAGDSVEVYMLP